MDELLYLKISVCGYMVVYSIILCLKIPIKTFDDCVKARLYIISAVITFIVGILMW